MSSQSSKHKVPLSSMPVVCVCESKHMHLHSMSVYKKASCSLCESGIVTISHFEHNMRRKDCTTACTTLKAMGRVTGRKRDSQLLKSCSFISASQQEMSVRDAKIRLSG